MSHDVATLADAAFDRIAKSLRQPGVFLINARAPFGEAINSLVLVLECSTPAEWASRVTYLPLR